MRDVPCGFGVFFAALFVGRKAGGGVTAPVARVARSIPISIWDRTWERDSVSQGGGVCGWQLVWARESDGGVESTGRPRGWNLADKGVTKLELRNARDVGPMAAPPRKRHGNRSR